MNNLDTKYIPEPNPVTYPQHLRQMWIQIRAPMIVGLLAILIIAFFATQASNPDVSRWGNISTIFLIIPLGLILLVTFAILGLIVYGLYRLLNLLPRYAHMAQLYVYHYSQLIIRLADRVAQPIIRVNGFFASLRVLRKRLRL
jgi:hypothetical protein